jgi:hypothetical protein
MMAKWIVAGVFLLLDGLGLSTGARVIEERRQAEGLWEQAIIAKGGRDRLAAINSFAIREKTVFKAPTLPEMAVGKVSQVVCELPNLWWEFVDYRPGQMGYSVRIVNTATGLGWASHGGPTTSFLKPDTHTAYRMRQLQYVLFLETRWVRPTPVRAARVQLNLKPADRLETDVEGEQVVYFLDVSTHLPLRIETSRENPLKPPRPGPGMKAAGPQRFTYEFDKYYEVDGVQVPERMVRDGGSPADVILEINPKYDPALFTKPPSPNTMTDSWRKGSGVR